MDVWNEVFTAIRADFRDLPTVTEATQVILRLTLAALLGGLLGFERELAGKAAGTRTHMMVALGSALFILIPAQLGIPNDDLSRILQGIITGVGFLGAGTILKGGHRGQIYGLTTAAGIWFTAAIGIAAGLGREATAFLGTFLAFLIFTLVPRIVVKQPASTDSAEDDE